MSWKLIGWSSIQIQSSAKFAKNADRSPRIAVIRIRNAMQLESLWWTQSLHERLHSCGHLDWRRPDREKHFKILAKTLKEEIIDHERDFDENQRRPPSLWTAILRMASDYVSLQAPIPAPNTSSATQQSSSKPKDKLIEASTISNNLMIQMNQAIWMLIKQNITQLFLNEETSWKILKKIDTLRVEWNLGFLGEFSVQLVLLVIITFLFGRWSNAIQMGFKLQNLRKLLIS